MQHRFAVQPPSLRTGKREERQLDYGMYSPTQQIETALYADAQRKLMELQTHHANKPFAQAIIAQAKGQGFNFERMGQTWTENWVRDAERILSKLR